MPYIGGKSQSGVYQRIINLIPPHGVYIEPFLGSGAILRLKKPAPVISYGVDRATPNPALRDLAHVIQGCGIEFLENYPWQGNEFVYCDPPYVLSTRGGREYYEHEMTDADHARLLAVLKSLPCPVLLSGYPSPLYEAALTGWEREEFEVMTRGHTWATEVLWFNYPRPAALHDVSFVGTNYRDRLRIKRKKARWAARLKRMPALERAALFSALVDAMDSER